jgi:hypothetical protein
MRLLLALLLASAACNDRSSPADAAGPDRPRLDAAAERTATDAVREARADALAPDTKPRPPARWDQTGSLAEARQFHTATLLLDGSVLVVGGSPYSIGIKSAERYDPKTGSWSAAAAASEAKVFAEAFRLKNGRVLVVQGCHDWATVCSLSATELYDPASGSWKLDPGPLLPRTAAAMTALADGRIFLAGGFTPTTVVKTLELYDPGAGSWSSLAAALPTSRNRATASPLANGKILIAGGFDGDAKQALASLLAYDPKNGLVTTLAPKLAEARFEHTATVLQDGRVLLIGGICDNQKPCDVVNAELYDPLSDTIASAGSPAVGVHSHTATLLQDGRVLFVGGALTSKHARLFDPKAMSWSATATPSAGRSRHTATLLGDGRVLIAGGFDHESNAALASAEIYTP